MANASQIAQRSIIMMESHVSHAVVAVKIVSNLQTTAFLVQISNML